MDSQTALGILTYRVSEMETSMKAGFLEVKAQINSIGMVPLAQYIAEKRESDRRIAKLEDSQTWLVRSVGVMLLGVIGSVIGAVVAVT